MIKKMILRHTELEGEETDDHILPFSSLKCIWKWDCMHQGLVKIHNVSGYSVVQQTLMSTCNNMPGGLLSWISSKEFAWQCRRHKRCRFDPWVGKIPWRREWQPTPILLLGESHGRGAWWDTVHRVPKSQTWLSDFTHFTNASWYIYYTHHIFFIHSSVDRHLGCFHVWASVNSIAVKIGKYVSFWISFIWICPGVEMQDHMVSLFLV